MVMRKNIQLPDPGVSPHSGQRFRPLHKLRMLFFCLALFAAAQLYLPGEPAVSLADGGTVLLPKIDLTFTRNWQNTDTQYEADSALKSGLDTLALALGGLVKELRDPEEQKELLIQALDGIPPRNDYSGYVALWERTVDIHTPPTPDSAGLDFGFIQDVNGHYFVQDMFEKVEQGGGFTDYTLVSWEGREQVVRRAYARPVPGTGYWLMSWRILDKEPVGSTGGSSVGSTFLAASGPGGKSVSGGMLWTGACVSGLVLAVAYRSSRQRVSRAAESE